MKHELVIGKYTLESLTNGMYASPLDLYREYIQNAVDSIDDAVASGIGTKDQLKISIAIDKESNTINIKDNGCGISVEKAVGTLIDIGNSGKNRTASRGFRGIGRLAGLGYCQELVFTTSSLGETQKTIVKFNAQKLTQLLLVKDEESVSVRDVIEQVVEYTRAPEHGYNHYFEVALNGVTGNEGLLDLDAVKEYLLQHAPLPFAKEFHWGRTIQSKFEMEGYAIPTYNIVLNGEALAKPYANSFVSDRIKKTEDMVKDIHIQVFHRDDKPIAIMWYADTSFFGTLNDNLIKGVRIRQGNILIGDKTTCNAFFKEERFNGWVMGELHVLDSDLIANSRRDNFEKNEAYYALVQEIQNWAASLSKTIRNLSYERSLTREKKAVIEAQEIEDVNDLCSEDLSYAENASESDYLDSSDSRMVAESDYIGKLSFLLEQKKAQTRYTALNINSKLTMEQRRVLERVFDLIQTNYDKDAAEAFINTIAKRF